ncbi:VOC family protein [Ornithinicoccus hortensis]|uniref:Putative glyoxalase superfamily protein PhnB n=1 Tax=Ornithinicoccus hortensis TaxID=82346 RepID=A0A542YLY8_9MICO|nr:VOC family protein [Ornithinicoccus hortensis]TQL49098.1 putative glyoxalase superfamily protein PhnB [Ornithinicoccus hortensis]
MLRGLSTIVYTAEDVAEAVDWYARVLGAEPYFRRPEEGPPAYAEFRIGDYAHELGIMDRRYWPDAAVLDGPASGASVAYWAVDDVRAARQRLLDLGAVALEEVTVRGPGFVTASVRDPFGNVLGIMENQHYQEVLAQRPAGLRG